MRTDGMVWLAAALAALPLAMGCGGNVSPLQSGSYELGSWEAPTTGGAIEPAGSVPEVSLELSVEAGTATFMVEGEAPEVRDIEVRDRDVWVSMCPTNVATSLVEVAGLGGTLTLGEIEVEAPFLMAECWEGNDVYLGDGTQGPSFERAGTCRNDGTCLVFRGPVR